MAIKFKKITIKNKEKVFTDLVTNDVTQSSGILKKESKQTTHKLPHNDLLRCFDKMVPHLVFSLGLAKTDDYECTPEWFSAFKYSDEPLMENIKVTGMTIGKDYLSIKLHGTIENYLGEESELNSPSISLLDEGEEKYPLLQIIRENFDDLITEATLYEEKEKYGISPQKELQF